jgi:hypothetical protein
MGLPLTCSIHRTTNVQLAIAFTLCDAQPPDDRHRRNYVVGTRRGEGRFTKPIR